MIHLSNDSGDKCNNTIKDMLGQSQPTLYQVMSGSLPGST